MAISTQQHSDVLRFSDSIIQMDNVPEICNYYFYKIVALYELHDYQNAIASIDKFLEDYEDCYFKNYSKYIKARSHSKLSNYLISNAICNDLLLTANSSLRFRATKMMANNYAYMNEVSKAKSVIDSLIQVGNHSDFALIMNRANISLRNEDFNEANRYYYRALELLDESDGSDILNRINKGRIYSNLMQSYGKMNHDSIHITMRLARLYKMDDLGTSKYSTELSSIYQNLAEFYLSNSNLVEANAAIDTCILHHTHYLGYEELSDFYDGKYELYNLYDRQGLLEYLYIKIKIESALNHQIVVEKLFVLIDHIIETIKTENYGVSNKIQSQAILSDFYKRAYHHFINQKRYDLALQYSQKLKGTILFQNLYHNQLTNILPDSIRVRFLALNVEKNQMLEQLYRTSSQDSILSMITENRREQEELNNWIHKHNPSFFNKKYINQAFTISHIQEGLQNNESLLDFIVDNDSIYVIEVIRNSVNFTSGSFSSKKLELFHQVSERISKAPSIADWSFEKMEDLKKDLKSLSKILLFDNRSQKYYRIVSHDILNNFPFSALIEESGEFVITNKSFAYSISIPLWINSLLNERVLNDSIYIYAPPLVESMMLPYSQYEIDNIKEIFSNCEMKEQLNFHQINKNNQLHIITHAIIDNENSAESYLAHRDPAKRIKLGDISNHTMSASLVSINSCKSNDGKYLEQEGVQSFARAFREAGIPSIIATSWNIDDFIGARMMTDVYMNAHNGKSIREAIQNAKIKHLELSGYYESHPYYWSGTNLYGNDIREIEESYSPFKWGMCVILIVGLVICLIYLFKVFKS